MATFLKYTPVIIRPEIQDGRGMRQPSPHPRRNSSSQWFVDRCGSASAHKAEAVANTLLQLREMQFENLLTKNILLIRSDCSANFACLSMFTLICATSSSDKILSFLR
eukprot:GHVN01098721.1.p2 GENE.GHVN01098721.1~~GHVN01098721.1.p2  ORF type:complete len:108 (+),score=11.87 GHVN01098721.1:560-883(+)